MTLNRIAAIAVTLSALMAPGGAFAQETSGERGQTAGTAPRADALVAEALRGIRDHDFEPNNTPRGTSRGVADLEDDAWRVRILAIRDLVRAGGADPAPLVEAVGDEDRHVRHVAVTALGILAAEEVADALLEALSNDPDPIVRGQAAQALAQIGHGAAEGALAAAAELDASRNVRHRATLALGRLDEGAVSTPSLAAAWAGLDEAAFRMAKVGEPAPDFRLKDTEGNVWRLSDFRGKKTVALVWIFADWCPVCQREFRDLIEMEQQYKDAGVQVMTLECNDPYRANAMVAGRDIWWPHLVDGAGRLGAMYGIDPMEYVVHDEWINRPATVIVDPEGIVRFAYYGTYWGDRPTIEEMLEMIESGSYDFEHPRRMK